MGAFTRGKIPGWGGQVRISPRLRFTQPRPDRGGIRPAVTPPSAPHFLRPLFLLGCAALFWTPFVRAQTPTDGDFRSRASNDWNNTATWQTRVSGSWVNASSTPTSANNVYCQQGHTVNLTAAAACKDFHSQGGNLLQLNAQTLSVSGKVRGYAAGATSTATGADGTFYSSQVSTTSPAANAFSFSGAGKISLVGSSRIGFQTGEWGATVTTVPFDVALTAGQTLSPQTNAKARSWTFTSGTYDATTRQVSADDGTAGGNITISSGFTYRSSITGASPLFQRTGSTPGATLTLASGATLIVTGASPSVAMATSVFNGTVEYSGSGQTLLVGASGGPSPGTYTHLRLGGTGNKTLSVNTTVNGSLTFAGTDHTLSLNPGGTITYGASVAITNSTLFTAGFGFGQTFAAGNTFTFTAGGGVNSNVGKISVNGALALNANPITVNVVGAPLANGTYRLLESTGALTNTGTFAAPTITGVALPSGASASISVTTGTAGHVDLVISGGTGASIATSPASLTVGQGCTSTFTVVPNGSTPLTYAWRKRGSGWGNAWTLTNNTFRASAGSIDVGGISWGIQQNTGSGIVGDAVRSLPGGALSAGQSLQVSLQNGNVDTGGTVGISLQDAGGNNAAEFYFVGGQSNYTLNDATGSNQIAGFGFTNTGVRLSLTMHTATTFTLTATKVVGGATVTLSGSTISGRSIQRIRFFNFQGGNGLSNNCYFNSLSVQGADDNASNYTAWITGSDGGQRALSNGPTGNGSTYAGATTATLQITSTASADATATGFDCVVANSGAIVTSAAATLTVGAPLAITTTTLPGGAVGSPYSVTPTATGGSGIYSSWSHFSGTLPPGISVNSSTGEISGTPTLAGNSTFTISVTDSNGCLDIQVLNLNIVKGTPTATLALDNPSVTYTGLAQAPAVSIVTSSVPGTVSNVRAAGQPTQTGAGTYAVLADFVPTNSANYNSLPDLSLGNIVIQPAPLTVTGVTANDKVYNGQVGATLSGTAAYAGLVNGEMFPVGGVPFANFVSPNVGSGIAVSVLGYTEPSGNYVLTQPSLSASITPAAPVPFVSGSLTFTYNTLPQGPTGSGVNGVSGGTMPSGTLSLSYEGEGATVYGPSPTRPTNAGSYRALASITAAGNYSAATSAPFSFVIEQKLLLILADPLWKNKGAADPALTYVPIGLLSPDTLGGSLVRAPGEAAGIYAISQGTVSAGPNYLHDYSGADFVIAGPLGAGDSATKPSNSTAIKIPLSSLLGNDVRVASDGSMVTSNLALTAVTPNGGNGVSIGGTFVFFTPNPSVSSEFFTYTVTDTTNSTTDTVTVTVTTAGPSLAPFALNVVQAAAASYDGGGDTTSKVVDFIAVPGQSIIVEYSTDLLTWTAANGGAGISTGATGSFFATFTASGDQTTLWNTTMYFRGRY